MDSQEPEAVFNHAQTAKVLAAEHLQVGDLKVKEMIGGGTTTVQCCQE